MRKAVLIWMALLATCTLTARAQRMEAPRISGYLNNSTVYAATHPDLLEETLWQNIVYLRTDLDWRASSAIRIDAGMRNIVYTGNATALSYIKEYTDGERGWAGMTFDIVDRERMLYRLNIDRLSLQWSSGALEVKVGRQRIDWGQTLVWNPTNIFNPHSFSRFNCLERPGCDALRTTYYHNETSYSEMAISPDRNGRMTTAFRHGGRMGRADYNLMTGIYREEDAVAGAAMTYGHGELMVRTEGALFVPLDSKDECETIVQIAAGADYAFNSNLTILCEVLYRNRSIDTDVNSLMFYTDPHSARDLSVSRWSILAQAVYLLTPHLSVRLSASHFTDKRLSHAGFNLNYRMGANIETSLFAHFANYASQQPIKIKAELGYVQLKWSF
ncbi:hypothetical protein JN06_00473 [Bacteroides zoogleoformans]|uniref:DUF5723 domain-containing protein n=1 Tax=Bacteroides zoogleoformans TaxID=28119 RepID=A0ABM6T8I8_9BACE|nr:hypothetical protein [Bacteroides zoogleoformans]AVM53172.1 hypothetical protein C4H11_09720 [Bacteroides zoogleoformans]TWJ17899.1 hypothetical protein JN06_00473 [Bacteroides zoogleoformans]